MSAIRESEIGFGGSSEDSSPTIILRRGKTELKVTNIPAIIKRINEMYPGDSSYCGWNQNWNRIKRELTDAEKIKQRKWMDAARNWFKTEMFGGSDDFEVVVSEPQTSPTLVSREETLYQTEAKPVAAPTPQEPPVVHSVNKNAYEIRTDILGMALDWVKFRRSYEEKPQVSDEDVLATASKFYRFVENRR